MEKRPTSLNLLPYFSAVSNNPTKSQKLFLSIVVGSFIDGFSSSIIRFESKRIKLKMLQNQSKQTF